MIECIWKKIRTVRILVTAGILFMGQSHASLPQSDGSINSLVRRYRTIVKIFDRWGLLGADYPNNRIYLGTAGQGVYELDLSELPKEIQYRKILENVWVTAIFVRKNNDVWIGIFDGTSYRGISIRRNGQWTLLDERNGLISNCIRSIIPKNEAEILIGTLFGIQGVHCPQGKSPHPSIIYTKNHYIPINDIALDGDRILIASDYGLFSVDRTRSVLVTTQNGLLNFKINSVLRDDKGYIWLGTDEGIKRLKDDELEELKDLPGYIPGKIERIKEHPREHTVWFLCNGQLSMFKEDAFRFPLKTILSFDSGYIEDYVFTPRGIVISQRGKGLKYIDLMAEARSGLKIICFKVHGPSLEIIFSKAEYYTYNLDDKGWSEGMLSDRLVLSDLNPGKHKLELKSISTSYDLNILSTFEFKSYRWYFVYPLTLIIITLACTMAYAAPILKFNPDMYRIYLFVIIVIFTNLLFLNERLAILQFENRIATALPVLILSLLFYKFQGMIFMNKDISDEGELDRLYLKLRGFDHGSMNRNNLFRFIRLVNHFRYKSVRELEKNLEETVEIMDRYVLPEMNDILRQLMRIGKYYPEAKGHRRVLKRFHRKDLKGEILSGKFDYLLTKRLEQVYELFKTVRGELMRKFYSCDFFQCCRDVVSEYKEEFWKRGITFSFDISEFRETKVIIKSYELCKILENLIENAIEAMEGRTKKQLRLEIIEDEIYLTLRMIDTGCGIPKDLHKRIFDRDFTTKMGDSRGLGLYYSKETLANYGGSIQIVESNEGHGTTIEVKLRILS